MNKIANKEKYPNHSSTLTSEDFFWSIRNELNPFYWARICKAKGIKFVELLADLEQLAMSIYSIFDDFQESHLFVETILYSNDVGFIENGVTRYGSPRIEGTPICFLYFAKGFSRRLNDDPNSKRCVELLQLWPSTYVYLRFKLEKNLDWDSSIFVQFPRERTATLIKKSRPKYPKSMSVDSFLGIALTPFAVELAYSNEQSAPNVATFPTLFNLVLDLTRKLATMSDFKRHHNSRLAAAEKSRLSAITYVNTLMSRHESLLVFRLNCFVPLMDGYEASAKLAKTWLKKLANNRRNNALFDEMLGYIWKLDFNFKFGCYLHFIFFYKANPWTSVHELSHQIGSYWQRQLAKGDPCAFYLTEDELPRGKLTPRFGTVSYDNHQLRWQLDQLIHYLSHKDLYMQFGGSSKQKRFGRGLLPSEGLTDSEEVSESGAIPEV